MYFKGILKKPYISLSDILDNNSFNDVKEKCFEEIEKSNCNIAKAYEFAVSTWPGIKSKLLGKMILLSESRTKLYKDIQSGDKRVHTKQYENFKPFLDPWLKSLPFKEYGRVIFFITFANREAAAHRDLESTYYVPPRNEFIWIPLTQKKFYILTSENEKVYPEDKIIWFNSTDYHGVDPLPHEQISLRIDGIFTDEFRKEIIRQNIH